MEDHLQILRRELILSMQHTVPLLAATMSLQKQVLPLTLAQKNLWTLSAALLD